MTEGDSKYVRGLIDGKITSNSKDCSDRISALPDELLDFILERLPMCDVVRTSVLSKRWSKCWTRYGKLDFGVDFVEKYIEGKEYGFAKIIDSLLLQQKGPVFKFDLYLCDLVSVCWSRHLDRWINFLSEHDIRDLTIYGRRLYTTINANIFNCSSLQNLELAACELGPSKGFSGFPYLTNLEIDGCIIPKTEWEIMINSPSLRTLTLRCPMDGDPVQVGGPKIKSLIVGFDESQPVYLKDSPNLTEASIWTMLVLPENHKETSRLNQFVSLLANTKTLNLVGLTLSSLACDTFPLRLPTTLRNLEHLELHLVDIVSLVEVSCAFCLIRSSPNLQSLNISLYNSNADDNEDNQLAVADFLTAQEAKGIMSGIQTVTFFDLEGSELEVDFISTILDCCPMLESIKVTLSPYVYSNDKWFVSELRSLHGSLLVEPYTF